MQNTLNEYLAPAPQLTYHVINQETLMSLKTFLSTCISTLKPEPSTPNPQFTDLVVNQETITSLQTKCDEFLVHAVDVEGKMSGIEGDLVKLLGQFCTIPCTVIPQNMHIHFRLLVDTSNVSKPLEKACLDTYMYFHMEAQVRAKLRRAALCHDAVDSPFIPCRSRHSSLDWVTALTTDGMSAKLTPQAGSPATAAENPSSP